MATMVVIKTTEVPDHVRGAVFGELPGKVPPLLKTGRGAPAGQIP